MIIGLGYKKQVGKDTVGKYLVGYYGFRRRAFADSVKSACQTLFGFTEGQMNLEHLKEEVDERWGITPRKAMQQVGSGMRKIFGDDFWLRKLNIPKDTDIVITDIRHKNEFDFVCSNGGILIKITRSDIATDNHETETALDGETGWDYIIENKGSLEDLCNQVDAIMLENGFIPEY